jgi:hypothetical protein
VVYNAQRQDRWKIVTAGVDADNSFAAERVTRLTVLEILYYAAGSSRTSEASSWATSRK